jgi:hypothetical protein
MLHDLLREEVPQVHRPQRHLRRRIVAYLKTDLFRHRVQEMPGSRHHDRADGEAGMVVVHHVIQRRPRQVHSIAPVLHVEDVRGSRPVHDHREVGVEALDEGHPEREGLHIGTIDAAHGLDPGRGKGDPDPVEHDVFGRASRRWRRHHFSCWEATSARRTSRDSGRRGWSM